MRNQPPDPREIAQMIVGGCLKKAVEGARNEADGRSVSEVLLTDPIYHSTLLSRRDLESIALWLGVSLYGKDSRLNDVFLFVQEVLGDDGFGPYFMQEAPGITVALDSQSPRVTFIAAA